MANWCINFPVEYVSTEMNKHEWPRDANKTPRGSLPYTWRGGPTYFLGWKFTPLVFFWLKRFFTYFFRSYTRFQCYGHSGYILPFIFRQAYIKQDRLKSTNHSPLMWPFKHVAHLHRRDMKQTSACIVCDWLISNSPPKDDVERWLSNDVER